MLAQFGRQDFRDQLFDLPAGGAVADRDHVEIVLADQLDELRAAGRFLLVAADDVDHVVTSSAPNSSSTASLQPFL